MTGVTRSVAVRLSAEVSGLVRGYQQAKTTTLDFAAANTQALQEVGDQAGKIGLVAAAGVAVAVKRFSDFDAAMSSVAAASGETGQSLAELRDLALELGAASQYSAAEAAEGIENLSKAGVQTQDILGGALKGSLDLAAAGQIAVGDAAEYMATALTQFSLAGSEATHVADLLAAGAGKAQGEVADMALALDYAGVPAANLGVSIEQTAGAVALLAKNGIIGEKAGTSLRGMLASLTSPSTVAAQTMKNLSIEVFDAQGNFIGLDGVAGQLRKRLNGLTQEERAYALGKIFGNEQMQAANVLYREGARGVRDWTREVNDSGFAAEQAAQKTDNLNGDIERLGGALDSLFIGSASGANGPLRQSVQTLTSLVELIDALPDPVKATGLGMLALAGAVGLLAFAGTRAITAVAATKANLATLRAEAAKTDLALRNMDLSMGGVARKIGRAAAPIAGIALATSEVGDSFEFTNSASLALMGTLAGPFGAALGGVTGLALDLAAANNDAADALERADNALNSGNAEAQTAAMEELYKVLNDINSPGLIDKIRGNLGELLGGEYSPEKAGVLAALADLDRALRDTSPPADGLAELMGEALAPAMGQTAEQFGLAADSVDEFSKSLDPLFKILDRRDSLRDYEASLRDLTETVKENGQKWDTSTEKGAENQAMLDGVARAALDAAKSLKATERVKFLSQVADDIRERAEQLNIPKEQIRVIIDLLERANKTESRPKVKNRGTKEAKEELDDLEDQFRFLDQFAANPKLDVDTTRAERALERVWDRVQDVLQAFTGAVSFDPPSAADGRSGRRRGGAGGAGGGGGGSSTSGGGRAGGASGSRAMSSSFGGATVMSAPAPVSRVDGTIRLADDDLSRLAGAVAQARPLYGDIKVYGDNSLRRELARNRKVNGGGVSF